MAGIPQQGLSIVEQCLGTVRRGLPIVQNGMKYTLDTAVNLAECDALDEERMNSLKETMLTFCAIEHDIQQVVEASQFVMHEAKNSRDASQSLESMFESKLSEVQRKKTELSKHPKFVALEEQIENALQAAEDDSEATPAQGAIQLDEDIAMTQAEISTKCPITMMEMKNPYRNRHCKHTYDLDGAKELIKNRAEARCPVAGCINDEPLRLADLESNAELKRHIDKLHRKTKDRTSRR